LLTTKISLHLHSILTDLAKIMTKKIYFLLILTIGLLNFTFAQHPEAHGLNGENTEAKHEFDPASTAIHHISDANVFSILDWIRIPLPMILYAKDKGWDLFMSNKFHPSHHEDGEMAYNGYVMNHGSVHRIIDPAFPMGDQAITAFTHKTEQIDGKAVDLKFAVVNGQEYKIEERSTLDGGILGGGITSFYDFSMTKNVLAMLIVCLVLFWLLRKTLASYKKNPEKAPKGIAAFIEPMFLFVRDEVAIPFIGKEKYKKYFPLLLSIFFFILGLNLFGQVPFLGSTNVTGNITVTMILSLIVFFIVNINGNKNYWKHILWMPGVPTAIKPLLTAVEVASVFIKPLTLMLRLAGNISAGHIAILSFISLIFVFGHSGESLGGGVIGTAMAVPLTLFMMAIELLVAFLQAYVFTLLTAAYIGAATEEHHH
jgi:F-type H+-transporting ATPase subunit a